MGDFALPSPGEAGTSPPEEAIHAGGGTGDSLARAAYVLRCHLLEQIGRALALAGLDALLVKGAALAMTVYERPWDRKMVDMDFIVRPGTCEQVIQAIEGIGFTAHWPAGRPLSMGALGEVPLTMVCGGVLVLIEFHTMLDKIVSRPIDYGEIFARARPAPGFPGLLVPAAEDHALLVVLHAAGAEFGHTVAFHDLALLVRAGLDQAILIERAKRWRLATALFVLLTALSSTDEVDLPRSLLAAVAPGALRLAAVKCFYRIGRLPVGRASLRLGLTWVIRQTPLRDDPIRWGAGLLRYLSWRLIERVPFAWGSR